LTEEHALARHRAYLQFKAIMRLTPRRLPRPGPTQSRCAAGPVGRPRRPDSAGRRVHYRPTVSGSASFFDVLKDFCGSKPVFGTCAGAILLAREVRNPPQRSLGLLDAVVERNAYGRQIDSTILTAETAFRVGRWRWSSSVRRGLSRLGPASRCWLSATATPVLVQQGNLMAAHFIPNCLGPAGASALCPDGDGCPCKMTETI